MVLVVIKERKDDNRLIGKYLQLQRDTPSQDILGYPSFTVSWILSTVKECPIKVNWYTIDPQILSIP